jgi:predicted amidophosphoribosyltransferase
MGRFCTQCGNELTEIADVCLGCGRLVSKREIFKK